MNQEKIGNFIAKCRKEKKLTQSDLAEKLGVTDKSIGNWENGRNMPDLSLFKPLCDELGISINDLLSGERISEDKYQEKFEENIVNTIDYSTKKINLSSNLVGVVLIVAGVLISLTAMSIFASDSSWGSIYAVFGAIISLIGVCKLTRKFKYSKRLLICLSYFILYNLILFTIDYMSVVSLKQLPRFCYVKEYFENGVVCKNTFYNVYRINPDTTNEYVIIDTKKEYNDDTLPIVPFNRNKAGIDNIIKCASKYVGDNSNDGYLISLLPLSEYGYVFEIDSKNLGLTIDYHITDWYINENYYLEKSIVYNSVSIFTLIDNVEYIKYNFSGKSYTVTRDKIENNFPNYKDIKDKTINKENFNKYLESKINDTSFIDSVFKNIVA